MTTLAIMATYEKKRLKCYGTVAAGEHVAVTVTDGAQWMGEGRALRLRVLFGPNTVAVFPFAEGDAWTTAGTQDADATCELNLNTVQAEKYLKHGGTCLWILDDIENHTLYATGEFDVLPWPKRRGIDEPIDLDGYPLLLDEINGLREDFEAYQQTVSQMLATKQDTIFDLATIRSGATSGATAVQPSQIARFVDGAEYRQSYGEQNNPAILFMHGTNVIVALDATPFVKDGMVSNVKVKDGNLVITFNTDSGKQPISIPLTDIFNPDNYYNKGDVNALLAGKQNVLTFDNAPTSGSNNPVKSGGIWSAIWGALAALPTGFPSLYDWCVAQLAGKVPTSREVNGKALSSDVTLTGADIAVSGTDATKIDAALAGKASTADATLAERGFSEWEILNTPLTQAQKEAFYNESPLAAANDYAVAIGGTDLYVGNYNVAVLILSNDELSLTYDVGSTEAGTIWGPAGTTVATRTALQGYQLGSQSDKPLASEAEAEALRQGKQSALSDAQLANIAAVSNALAFDSTHTYAAGDPVVYNGTLYTFTATHTGAWTGSDVSAVDIIATLAGKLDKSGGTFGATTISFSDDGIVVSDTQSSNSTLLSSSHNFLAHRDGLGVRYFAAPSTSGTLALTADIPADIPYDLGTPIVIDTAFSETVEGETFNYGVATLADRTANVVQVTAATALDELRITFPAATSGKVRDFGLRVEIGTGSAALAAPALVPIAPSGETIKIENNAAEIPALADGTATAKGVTLLYFSENSPGIFVVKGEQVEEVA